MNEEETIYDVVAIGNAMVDIISKVSNQFLLDRNLAKGTMTLTDAKTAGQIYADIVPDREVSGGAAANTVAGLASLGCDCAFIGKVYDDELGQQFKRSIGSAGIDFDTPPLLEGPSTGRSIILVTPDAERSMFTYLGAAKHLSADDVDENIIKASKYVLLEGYLFDMEESRKALYKAAELAHKHNRTVILTLSDYRLVSAYRGAFLKFIEENVDILFSNEREIKTLFETDDLSTALRSIKTKVDLAAVTRHDKGSVVISGKIRTYVEAEQTDDIIDMTGAGDLYAAGFIYGLVMGKTLGICALIGSMVASEVITHYGARPEVSLRGLVRKNLLQYQKKI